jgi:hypothetical protein
MINMVVIRFDGRGVANRTTGALGRQEPLTVESILPILNAFFRRILPYRNFIEHYWRRPMAEKAKTAQKAALRAKRVCPLCGADSKVVQYTGFGQMKGFFWVCDKNPEHLSRTR